MFRQNLATNNLELQSLPLIEKDLNSLTIKDFHEIVQGLRKHKNINIRNEDVPTILQVRNKLQELGYKNIGGKGGFKSIHTAINPLRCIDMDNQLQINSVRTFARYGLDKLTDAAGNPLQGHETIGDVRNSLQKTPFKMVLKAYALIKKAKGGKSTFAEAFGSSPSPTENYFIRLNSSLTEFFQIGDRLLTYNDRELKDLLGEMFDQPLTAESIAKANTIPNKPRLTLDDLAAAIEKDENRRLSLLSTKTSSPLIDSSVFQPAQKKPRLDSENEIITLSDRNSNEGESVVANVPILK